jgi:hypothetical protein
MNLLSRFLLYRHHHRRVLRLFRRFLRVPMWWSHFVLHLQHLLLIRSYFHGFRHQLDHR